MESNSSVEPLRASRLVGFSDGVFAVAITLLVLNIQVPDKAISLHALVAQQLPSYVMFVVTFAMLGIKWLNHHRLFTLIRRVDTTVNILNLALLLGICAVPFTTSLLAKYMRAPDAALASSIYGAVWVMNGFLYTAILAYAMRRRLVEPSPDIRRMFPLYIAGPLSYLIAIGTSFLNIYAGIALYLVTVSMYVVPQKVEGTHSERE